METFARAVRTAALTLSVALAALLIVGPVVTASARVDKNYNEGWNAFQADRALGGAPLYPAATELIANNYPPLSFYLVGGLGALVGDNIFAGRLVAFASFLAVALTIGRLAGSLTHSASAGWAASALFVGTMATLHPAYIATNDPQWLAQAIQISALALLLERPDGPLRIRSVVALTLLAGLVKHSLIALPIALTIELLLHDRRQARTWLIGSSIALLTTAGALYALYGPHFFADVLGYPRSYALAAVWDKSEDLLPRLLPLALACAAFARLEPAGRRKRILLVYVLVSATLGAFALGGAGVARNVLDDLVIGLAIAAGVAIHRIGERFESAAHHAATEAAAILIVLLSVFALSPGQLLRTKASLARLDVTEANVSADLAFLSGVNGQVACESLALCYWAGKPFEIDLFAVGQKLRSGALSIEEFRKIIENGHFRAIQLDRRTGTKRLPPAANEAIFQNYTPRPKQSGGVFLVPRKAGREEG